MHVGSRSSLMANATSGDIGLNQPRYTPLDRTHGPYGRSRAVGRELAAKVHAAVAAPRQLGLGEYSTWPGTNVLEPQASVKILDALLEMAGELKRAPQA